MQRGGRTCGRKVAVAVVLFLADGEGATGMMQKRARLEGTSRGTMASRTCGAGKSRGELHKLHTNVDQMPTPSKTDLNPVQVVGTHRIKPSRGAAKTWLGITCRTGALLQAAQAARQEAAALRVTRGDREQRVAGGRSKGGLGMVCGIFGVASTQGTAAAAHNSSWALARERNKRAR
jgi:hypothetical protein